MAQKHLAQDLTTSKVQSLPKELRDIAENLIGDKFGYEEVVERKSSNPFHYQTVWGVEAADDGYVSVSGYTTHGINPTVVRQVGNGEIVERFDFETKRSILSAPIEFPGAGGFRDAMGRLDMADARKSNKFAYLTPDFAKALFSTLEFDYYADLEKDKGVGYECPHGTYMGQLFGVSVFVSRDRQYPEIQAYR